MTTAALNTGLPGKLQKVAMTTADVVVTVTGRRGNAEVDGAVQLTCAADWTYNSDPSGPVDMAVVAGRVLTIPIPFGQPITFYAKTGTTADLLVFTVR